MEELEMLIGVELYKEYIDFIEENRIEPIKYESETHHILPKCAFPQYFNLKEHAWNAVELTHRSHFIAHYILAKSGIDSFCVAFFINNLHKDFDIDDEEYLSNYENIKKVAVLKNSEGVKRWLSNLTSEERLELTDKKKIGMRRFYDEIADAEFFENRTNALLETLSKRSQEEWDEINEKNKSTRLNNNPNSFSDAGNKAAYTTKNTILESGLSIKETATIKMLETRLNNNSYITGTIKGRDTMYNKIDEYGLNGYQQAYLKGRENVDAKEVSLKAAKTMEETILENGLSIKEDRIKRGQETMKKIGEYGLTGYQRAGLKLALVDKRIFYNVKIYNENNELYEQVFNMQRDEIIEKYKYLPIKTLWYGNVYTISKNSRKENKQYKGYYLIKEKLSKN